MPELTERQQQILAFVRSFIAEHGYPPSIREIGGALDISSTSVVNYNLNKLERAGYVERDSQISRGLKLVSTEPAPGFREVGETYQVPVLGTIAAGRPIPVPESIPLHEAEEFIGVTQDLVGAPSPEIFALHVKGDSMIDALINDGDVVVMEAAQTAHNGEMVAAWIADREETTLKRFYLENGRVRLQPANPAMEPLFVDASQVQIQGRVVAVIRNLN